MPISVTALFAAVGLPVAGTVRWGSPIPSQAPGVYAISLSDNPVLNAGLLPRAPVCPTATGAWIARVTTLTCDGHQPPTVKIVTACLQDFWLPDENIVYIGKATCLLERVGQFVRHRLGEKRPHAGGHWLKALSILPQLHLHFATCPTVADAETMEHALLDLFIRQVSPTTRAMLHNPDMPVPFANREFPQGTRKQNRIRMDVVR